MDTDSIPYWSIDSESLFQNLNSRVTGLRSSEASNRVSAPHLKQMQPSRLNELLLLRQFKSPIVQLLLVAAVLSLALGEIVDAVIIIVIISVSGILGFLREHKAFRAIDKLIGSVIVHSDVFRDGREVELELSEVVRGDVVVIRTGDLVPGDARIISSNHLYLDESALTGETFPRHKQPGILPRETQLQLRTNCVHFGTHVASGEAQILICEVGDDTEFGQVTGFIGQQHVPTSFERGVTSFGYLLMRTTALLIFFVLVVNVIFGRPFLDSILFSLALAVGLTPQMLPAIVTLSLSRGAITMAKKLVIVKRLDAIEDVGSLDILCTDKTGTLTVGTVEMNEALTYSGEKSERVHRLAWANANFQSGYSNPIDDAILKTLVQSEDEYEKVGEIPFDFTRRRMSVLVSNSAGQLLICKGSVESILSSSSSVRISDEKQSSLLAQEDLLRKNYEELSQQGLRVLAIASKEIKSEGPLTPECECDLVFEGFVTFFDPPKPNVEQALLHLRDLGVSVRIITGDNSLAAIQTASAVGIDATHLVTGQQIDQMSEVEIIDRVEEIFVFTEIDPIQKERIVRAYSANGHTVGFLGDGINDSPALHAADVGISVNTAVDIAKETADLVLLDKNLDVLAEGISQGRKVFSNTMKYVYVASSASFGNMVSLAFASLFLPFLPLLPSQVLLLNFMSDIPDMALATDNVDAEQLLEPRHWNMQQIKSFMLVFGLVSTTFDLLTFAVLRWHFHAGASELRTGWFIESVFTELAVMLVLRTRLSFFRSSPSKTLLLSSFSMGVLAVGMQLMPFGDLLGFQRLGFIELMTMLLITGAYILSTEIIKKKVPNLLSNR